MSNTRSSPGSKAHERPLVVVGEQQHHLVAAQLACRVGHFAGQVLRVHAVGRQQELLQRVPEPERPLVLHDGESAQSALDRSPRGRRRRRVWHRSPCRQVTRE